MLLLFGLSRMRERAAALRLRSAAATKWVLYVVEFRVSPDRFRPALADNAFTT